MMIVSKPSLRAVAGITADHVKTAEALKSTLKIICAASVPRIERGYGRKKGKLAMLEKQIEAALVKRVKALGGMAEKFTSPGRRSVPDRIVTLPGGRVIFVELKAPGAKPTENQQRDHERRRALGCDVRVIDSLEAVDAFPE